MAAVKQPKKEKNDKIALSFLLGLFTAFNIGFFIPMDFYLANISSIMLPLKIVMYPFIGVSIVIFAAVFLICLFTKGTAHRICCSLIFGISAAFYIEGNFLSLNLGKLDGSQYHAVWWKAIINILIWAAILILPFILHKKSEKAYVKVVSFLPAAILLIEIITISVSFVNVTLDDEGGNIHNAVFSSGKQRICSNKDLSTYSDDKNVIIILTDEYDSFYFDKSLKSDPESLEEFDGFTYYKNTLGAYGYSDPSIAYITTGNKLEAKDPYNNDKFFKNMQKNYKSNLYGVTDVFNQDIFEKYAENYITAKTDYKQKINAAKTFYRITFYKCMPDILKKYFWMYSDSFTTVFSDSDDLKCYYPDNLSFYNNITSKLNKTDKKCFKFIYLYGLHDPRNITKDLERAKNWSVSQEEEAVAVNKIVGKYLKILKDNGVYDNTEILLLADHGVKSHDHGKYPLLMYKPAEEKSEGIKTSNAPISYDDLYPTLLKMSGETPEGRTIWDIPEDETRTREFYETGEKITKNIKD